jgi:hypothetical protein
MATITREVEVEFTDSELADAITDGRNFAQVLETIKEIDSNVGDWDFTKEVIRHFLKDYMNNYFRDDDDGVEFLKEFGLTHTSEDDDEDEDEEEDKEEDEEPVGESHFHVYRDGKCYCGEPAP